MARPVLERAVRYLRLTAGDGDRDLLARAQAGDRAAFAAIVRRHGPSVLAASRQVLPDAADRDDVFQATFLVLARRADAVDPDRLAGWLSAVAHRLAVRARADARRRRVREATAAAQRATTSAPPDLSWREGCAILHEELDRLPAAYRRPLLLCYLEGRSRDEAAHLLGWSPGAVKGRLERGRRTLAARLTRRGVTLSAGLLAALTAESVEALTPELADAAVTAALGGASPAVLALVAPASGVGWLIAAGGVVAVALLFGVLGRSSPATSADPPAPVAAVVAAPGEVEANVAGTVVDEAGKPVAGAKVYWVAQKYPVVPAELRTTTGADGKFAFTVWHPAEQGTPSQKVEVRNTGFPFVVAASYGFGWMPMFQNTTTAVAVRIVLPPDTVPLSGQIVDHAGKPLPGVKVRLLSAGQPWDSRLSFAEWLKEVRDPKPTARLLALHQFNPENRVDTYLSELLPTAVTDRTGRFTLPGVGRDRVALVSYLGDGVAADTVAIVTRNMEGFTGHDSPPDSKRFYHGLPCRITAQAGTTVTGIVRDTDTGRPLPGVVVEVRDQLASSRNNIQAQTFTTDQNGRYRIPAVQSRQPHLVPSLALIPPAGSLYPDASMIVPPDAPGTGEVALDIAWKRGVALTVKVMDKSTGRPIAANCQYFPLPGNPFLDQYPHFHTAVRFGLPMAAEQRLVVPPGPGVVIASAPFLIYRAGVVPENLTRHVKQGQLRTARATLNIDSVQAFAAVDLKPDAADASVTLILDPGITLTGTVRGPDGQELVGANLFWEKISASGASTLSSRDGPLTAARFEARGWHSGVKWRVFASHDGKKLAGVAVIPAENPGPIDLRLERWGEVTGRFLDDAGRPFAPDGVEWRAFLGDSGREVSFGFSTSTNTTGLEISGHNGVKVWITPDGRFAASRVIPGRVQKFTVSAERAGQPRLSVQRDITVKPGETLDLGDVRLKP